VSLPARVAVSGASGRLGRAILETLPGRTTSGIGWNRPDLDLDDPTAAARLVQRDRPDLVIHCAAWTDVDSCARDPDLALRRNGEAVREMAAACVGHGVRMVHISTNEVFDGRRADDLGYAESDPTNPINPYGASKLAGETAAQATFDAAGMADALTIVRTAWLYGAPGSDFPAKIVAAADRLEPGASLRVVDDEVGPPTWTRSLAPAILELASTNASGVFHLTATGTASRFEWARAIIDALRPGTPVVPIKAAEFARASTPPAWAVLDTRRAGSLGIGLPHWREDLIESLELTM
jgi:dTDP-4-dehydrorhamnose reductase